MRDSVGEAGFGSPTAPAGAGCKVGPGSRGSQKKRSPLANLLPLLIVVLQPLLAAEPQSRIETQFF